MVFDTKRNDDKIPFKFNIIYIKTHFKIYISKRCIFDKIKEMKYLKGKFL